MATVSYSRKPLVLLRVRGLSFGTSEVLDFLNRYGGRSYELAEPLQPSSEIIYVTTANDRSTTRGIQPSSVLLHDPEKGGVKFLYGASELRRFGVDPHRLEDLEDGNTLDQILR